LWLEEWLNRALVNADFGCDELCVMVVVFATDSLPRAPQVSRFTRDSAGSPTLALHVVIPSARILDTAGSDHVVLLCGELFRGLPVKPLRKPASLDYPRLYRALLSCVEPFTARATSPKLGSVALKVVPR
jgi:hypothetical protein